jgi:hypothetical protein
MKCQYCKKEITKPKQKKCIICKTEFQPEWKKTKKQRKRKGVRPLRCLTCSNPQCSKTYKRVYDYVRIKIINDMRLKK